MKKTIKVIFVIISFILALGMFGCTNTEEKEDRSPMQVEWDAYIESLIPEVYSKSIKLPVTYEFSGVDGLVDVVWESSNTKSINNRGTYMGNIIDNEVTLTSSVYVDGELQFTSTYKTLAKGEMTEAEYIEAFNKVYLPDETYQSLKLEYDETHIFDYRDVSGTIEYRSADEKVLASDGTYTLETQEDITLTMYYTVTIRDFVINGSKEILVHGNFNAQRVAHAKDWLQNEWYKDERITEDMVFPTTDDDGIVIFEFESLNKNIVDDAGTFVNYVVDADVKFNVNIIMNDVSETMEITLKTIAREDMVDYILEKMHFDTINQSTFVTYVVSKGYHNDDYGFLNFFVQDLSEADIIKSESTYQHYQYGVNTNNTNVSELVVNKGMADLYSMAHKRPYITKSSTQFICVHDTGDNKFTAAQWANEVQTSAREVSWHFTVDDLGIYQQIPTDEVAYHAGDGSNVYGLNDTGVKYTIKNPKIYVDETNGYFYINGVKSKLKAPMSGNKYMTNITSLGLYTTLGGNGNYYMNNYYYNATYNTISNGGGNRNSVGIETCIFDGVKYSQVMRNTANLVAHLLNMYKLDTSRVLYHRNFSGKLCPQSMIRAKEGTEFTIDVFKELVEAEYFILKNLPNAKFTYESLNPDILDNQGRILKYVTEVTEVSYRVTVEFEGKTYTHTFTTTINPKE